jgi:hypothetical protein
MYDPVSVVGFVGCATAVSGFCGFTVWLVPVGEATAAFDDEATLLVSSAAWQVTNNRELAQRRARAIMKFRAFIVCHAFYGKKIPHFAALCKCRPTVPAGRPA